ncbi:hypothetical protein H6G33_21590 [Calothrix sp. FACHB-1219]|uniref:hypothetical protein n=1 Tax=unclassified Calothrix TaxID=2619626 RepID=UPI001685EAFE|nr:MULTISPECIES: hypothetical protein [unclassified Calothrix]MBD2203796.1 hypothetical protein [Calothrix sp. FACHB-168]MBD2219614.1 hypothetical protein [Calothrix sp. FACHB-1219]
MIHLKSSQKVKIVGLFSIFAIAGIGLTDTMAKAQDAAVLACVKEYTKLGISPDAALAECKKNALADCVKRLTSAKVVAKAVSESKDGYLIDLGDNESRWLEGPAWRDKGCKANTQGQYKRQSDNHRTFWGDQRSYEWFRQGFCTQSEIKLEQNYSLEEAKTLCELGDKAAIGEPKFNSKVQNREI